MKDYSDKINSFICRMGKLHFYQYADVSRPTLQVTFLLHTRIKLQSADYVSKKQINLREKIFKKYEYVHMCY